jgi:hypothetical protein
MTWLPKPILKGIAVILLTAMFTIPIAPAVFAQDVATACMDAERQAKSDISGGTWFLIGCLIGPIGYLLAMSEPNPPSTNLLGKSPEYVAAYTDCYRRMGKSIKTKNAMTGCIISVAVEVVLIVIYYVLIYETVTTVDDYYWY